jgi:hypothetical protein
VDGRTIGDGRPGPLTRLVMAEFREVRAADRAEPCEMAACT